MVIRLIYPHSFGHFCVSVTVLLHHAIAVSPCLPCHAVRIFPAVTEPGLEKSPRKVAMFATSISLKHYREGGTFGSLLNSDSGTKQMHRLDVNNVQHYNISIALIRSPCVAYASMPFRRYSTKPWKEQEAGC